MNLMTLIEFQGPHYLGRGDVCCQKALLAFYTRERYQIVNCEANLTWYLLTADTALFITFHEAPFFYNWWLNFMTKFGEVINGVNLHLLQNLQSLHHPLK